MIHGTRYTYERYLCRCEPCTTANREARRAYRARVKARPKPEPEPDTDKPQPRFAADLTSLRHAMTLEDWQAREARNHDVRPVTQDPIQRRSSEPVQPDRVSLIDLYVAGES